VCVAQCCKAIVWQAVCHAIVVLSSKSNIDFTPLKDSGPTAGIPARVDASDCGLADRGVLLEGMQRDARPQEDCLPDAFGEVPKDIL
jgi:hypothetical protein